MVSVPSQSPPSDPMSKDEKRIKTLLKRVAKARNFPANTCPASRHAEMIGEALAKGRAYPMLAEEPEYCGETLLATVAALYEARTKLAQLRTQTSPQDILP